VAAALLLVAPALPIRAEIGAPIPLIAQAPPAPAPAKPEPLAPPAPAATAPAPTPTAPQADDATSLPPPDVAVTATTLAPVDTDWIGTLGDAAHPLPQTMWQGTPRPLVAAALPRLQPTGSPVLQDLSRRLLLSNAIAPQGADPPDGPSLGALRVSRLMALGDADDALALIKALPTSMAARSSTATASSWASPRTTPRAPAATYRAASRATRTSGGSARSSPASRSPVTRPGPRWA